MNELLTQQEIDCIANGSQSSACSNTGVVGEARTSNYSSPADIQSTGVEATDLPDGSDCTANTECLSACCVTTNDPVGGSTTRTCGAFTPKNEDGCFPKQHQIHDTNLPNNQSCRRGSQCESSCCAIWLNYQDDVSRFDGSNFPIKICQTQRNQPECRPFSANTGIFFGVVIFALALLGSVIYMCFLNSKKKKEILKLKYKLKKAVKIIKQHDPNFQSVMPDGHDVLSMKTTSMYNQGLLTSPNKVSQFGGSVKSDQKAKSVSPNQMTSDLDVVQEDAKENLISLNGSERDQKKAE